MDFTITSDIAALRDQIDAFVDTHLIPLESDPSAYDAHENIAEDRLAGMRSKAREQGL